MAEPEEFPTELPPEPPSLDEITVPINESELEQFVTIRQADDRMKTDVTEFREVILENYPVDDLFAALDIDGEITPENLQDAILLIQEWFMGASDISDGDDITIDPDSFAAQFISSAGRGREYGGAVGMATLEVG